MNTEDRISKRDTAGMGTYRDAPDVMSREGRLREMERKVQEIAETNRIGGTFGEALELLKKGHRVARAGWNGRGMFLYFVSGSEFIINREPLLSMFGERPMRYLPHIDMYTATGECVPWLASQTDILATDWQVVTPVTEMKYESIRT